MKKKLPIFITIFVLLFLFYYFIPGFFRNTSVFVEDYHVSSDGKTITLNVAVSSSVGYVRDSKCKQKDNKLYLDFYSAFGGINGSLGAKDTFTFELSDDIDTIAIYGNNNTYKDCLIKDADGTWQRFTK